MILEREARREFDFASPYPARARHPTNQHLIYRGDHDKGIP
jgi:hypothetical protein